MQYSLTRGRPIGQQIYEQICVGIASGELLPKSRLSSVREVAVKLGVNPNTVQRAFEELERDGILYSVRGSGWFVDPCIKKAKEVLDGIVKEKTKAYFNDMKSLGLDTKSVQSYVKEWEE